MDLGMERFAHLPGGAGELDHGPACGDASDRKSMSLKPRGHGLNVFVFCAELLAVPLRAHPLMEQRRTGCMRLSQETLERRFVFRWALQHDQHSPQREVIGER